MWRFFDIVAPSARLPATYQNLRYDRVYPATIKVDKPLSVADVIAIYRDHLENTQFDLTSGMAAGPFGNPNRWDGGQGEEQVTFLFRFCVLFVCACSFVSLVCICASRGRAGALCLPCAARMCWCRRIVILMPAAAYANAAGARQLGAADRAVPHG